MGFGTGRDRCLLMRPDAGFGHRAAPFRVGLYRSRASAVAERRVGFAVGSQRGAIARIAILAAAFGRDDEAENVVPAARIAGHGEDVAVIGGDEDQRFFRIGIVDRPLDRAGELDRLFQRVTGLPGVVAMVDPPAFDHQVIALRIAAQPADGRGGHVGQRGLAIVGGAIDHIGHVAA